MSTVSLQKALAASKWCTDHFQANSAGSGRTATIVEGYPAPTIDTNQQDLHRIVFRCKMGDTTMSFVVFTDSEGRLVPTPGKNRATTIAQAIGIWCAVDCCIRTIVRTDSNRADVYAERANRKAHRFLLAEAVRAYLDRIIGADDGFADQARMLLRGLLDAVQGTTPNAKNSEATTKALEPLQYFQERFGGVWALDKGGVMVPDIGWVHISDLVQLTKNRQGRKDAFDLALRFGQIED